MAAMSTLARLLEGVALAFVGLHLLIALAALHRTRLGRRRHERRFGGDQAWPSCAVVVPTKGLPREAEATFRAFLDQDHPDFEVLFVVEGEDDPGFPLLTALASGAARARVLVAGPCTTGCQKNLNLVTGAAAARAEVLVFADNDIQPDPGWLRRMVAPLADPAITVTTAYRWLEGRAGTWGEDAHITMNLVLYAYFCAAAILAGIFVWGGSCALRTRDYLALGVADRWLGSVSDDGSLSVLLGRHRKRAYLIPGLLIKAHDPLGTPREVAAWFKRQLLHAKASDHALWAFAIMPTLLLGMALYLLLPLSLGAGLATGWPFRACGGGAALLFLAGELILGLLLTGLGPVRNRWRLALRMPLSRALQCVGALPTVGAHGLTWAQVRYDFDRGGRVTRIQRLQAPADPASGAGGRP